MKTIFTGIIIIISSIISLFYTFLIYPFRILFVGNKHLIVNKNIPFEKRLCRNLYYICHQIKDRNNHQLIKIFILQYARIFLNLYTIYAFVF